MVFETEKVVLEECNKNIQDMYLDYVPTFQLIKTWFSEF